MPTFLYKFQQSTVLISSIIDFYILSNFFWGGSAIKTGGVKFREMMIHIKEYTLQSSGFLLSARGRYVKSISPES